MIQVRLSDHLSGFITKMVYSMSHDPQMLEDKIIDIHDIYENDLESKRILSKEWFDLSEEKFNLYKLVCNALMKSQQNYWTVMTLSYSDGADDLFSLINYIDDYENYKAYCEKDSISHSECFNQYVCERMEMHFLDLYK